MIRWKQKKDAAGNGQTILKNKLSKLAAQVSRPGRLFLCLTIASDGVSETERSQHEADNSD